MPAPLSGVKLAKRRYQFPTVAGGTGLPGGRRDRIHGRGLDQRRAVDRSDVAVKREGKGEPPLELVDLVLPVALRKAPG